MDAWTPRRHDRAVIISAVIDNGRHAGCMVVDRAIVDERAVVLERMIAIVVGH